MSFFDSVFGGSPYKDNSQSASMWQPLTSLKQLEHIKESSHEKAVVIFKHSTRCGISRAVLKRFEADFDNSADADFYFLDLLRFREISNEMAQQFAVRHESPQILLIKNGKCVHDASHGDISFTEIANRLTP